MAVNEVALTASMRSNLLQLQKTEALIGKKQNTLATGNKINSALDGPTAFFAAKGLNQRAGDLSSLKDAMGQSVSTIQAADKGVTAIENLIEQARGLTTAAFASLDMDAGSIATRASLAKQFNTIKEQIDKLARDSGYQGKNLLAGDGLRLDSTSASRASMNSITGIDNSRITNVVKTDTYTVNITGSGKITGYAADLATAEQNHGLVGLKVSGTMSGKSGNFEDMSIQVQGAMGRLRTFTISDGKESRTLTYFDDTQTAEPKMTTAPRSGVAQVSEVAFTGTIEAGDTFSVTINNEKFTYEVTKADLDEAATNTQHVGSVVAARLQASIQAAITSNTNNFTDAIASVAVTDGKLVVTGDNQPTNERQPFKLSADAKNALTYKISETFASGATISFTVNRELLDKADNYGNGTTSIQKMVDIEISASNLQGQTIVRSGMNERGDNKLSHGEAAFAFDTGTVRFNVDQEQIMKAASAQSSANLQSVQVTNPNTQNDLTVQFNERNTNSITVKSVNLTTSGQGMQIDFAANNWMDRADIEEAVAGIDHAKTYLRSASQQLSTNLNIITTRESFTKEFSDVLMDGANKLTLADQNEEGANLLMLQTRQQLGTIALSLANQSQQSILSLF